MSDAPKPQRSPSDDTDRLREALARDLEDPIHGRDSRSISFETADGLIEGPLAPLLAALTAERTAREEAEASDAESIAMSRSARDRADRLAEESARLAAALRLLLPFVDRAAGEGVMWLEDCDSPQMDAADLCIAAAEALGMELGDDAYSAVLKQGEADIRSARALTSTKGADDGA